MNITRIILLLFLLTFLFSFNKSIDIITTNDLHGFIDEQKAHGKYKDIRKRKPNLDKSKKLLGYSPTESFQSALKVVIENGKK